MPKNFKESLFFYSPYVQHDGIWNEHLELVRCRIFFMGSSSNGICSWIDYHFSLRPSCGRTSCDGNCF